MAGGIVLFTRKPKIKPDYNCRDDIVAFKKIIKELDNDRIKLRELSCDQCGRRNSILINEITSELAGSTKMEECIKHRERVQAELTEELKPYVVMRDRTFERIHNKRELSKRVRFSRQNETFESSFP
ncbi:rpsE [Acrasis kona]|uniref:RpsE n=1 Tax=Acrasis kona TaxID=1008807 RepID=A0AAW2Z7E6_9EUKA